MLERFVKTQQAEAARLASMEKAGAFPLPFAGMRPSLARGIRENKSIAVIAEYKRASPSLGDINLRAEPEQVAAAYAQAGAAAISVLTEKTYFKGDLSFIERMRCAGLPLLRKDFLIDPLQVRETASTGASAILLIARILDRNLLAGMLRAANEAGLEAVLEIFDEDDLAKARQALAVVPVATPIIQVNNRDLDSLRVSDAPSQRLIGHKRDGELWISASGLRTREQMEERQNSGFDAVLVGSFLMQEDSPEAALASLCRKGDQA